MEQALLLTLQSLRFDGLVQIAALISACGNMGFIWLVIAVVFLFFFDKRGCGIAIIVSIAVLFVVSELVLEPMVARLRPCDAGIGVSAVMGVSHSGFSFPSGHAASSFAAATAIALMLGRKYATPAFVLAVLIALSRLYLGVHYPTDVLAGAVIGALIAFVIVWLLNTFIFSGPKERTISKGRHSL